jgi:hypothetical protein
MNSLNRSTLSAFGYPAPTPFLNESKCLSYTESNYCAISKKYKKQFQPIEFILIKIISEKISQTEICQSLLIYP